MSEKKPDSETTEERLSEKISIQTEEIKAEIQDKRESAEDTAEPSAAEPENAEETKSAEETGSAEESSVSKEQVQEEEPPAATQDEDFFYDDEKAYEARKAARMERRLKQKRRRRRRRIIGGVIVVAAAAIGIGVGFYGDQLQAFVKEQQVRIAQLAQKNTEAQKETETAQTSAEPEAETETEVTQAPEQTSGDELSADDKKLYRRAKRYAQQYDYDKAIKVLKSSPNYKISTKLRKAAKVYKKKKESCVSWPLDQVTHVFYHTLIKDTSKAFDGDYKSGDYDQVMTTIDEFNKITQSMYEKGYVMVSIYDMATVDENGNMTPGEILLPEGKIPFVLSEDDVCYYHYMDGDGFASKLVVDDDGKVRNEYIEDDGSVSVGDYDVVPLIDRFVEEHPDFSYRGARGIVALTGYNGILGYRTDSSYETRPDDLDADKVQWLDNHPDFDLNTEREGAKKAYLGPPECKPDQFGETSGRYPEI